MARKTTRTTQSYLAGIGAGGALLVCAVIGVLSLLGAVSVSVWPEPDASGGAEVVELRAPSNAPAELAGAEGLIASADTVPSAPPVAPDRGSDTPDGDNGPQVPGDEPAPPDDAADDGDAPPESGQPALPEPPPGGGRGTDGGQPPQQGKDGGAYEDDGSECEDDGDHRDFDDDGDDRGRDDSRAWAPRDLEEDWDVDDDMSNAVPDEPHGD